MIWIAGCEAPTPLELPAGGEIDATVTVDQVDGSTADVSVRLYGTAAPALSWDTCAPVEGGLGGWGGGGPVAGADAPWVTIDDRPVDLEPIGWLHWDGVFDQPTPGAEVSVGWSETFSVGAFDAREVVLLPEPVSFRPEPDAIWAIDPTRDLALRWRGRSDGRVHLSITDGEGHGVSCAVVDDGAFDVPHADLAGLTGDGLVLATRVAVAFEPLPDDDRYVMFEASARWSGDAAFR